VAERLRRAIQERYAATADGDLTLTISVGVAAISPDAESAADLVSAADGALYAAKRAGRNRVVMATPDAAVPGQRTAPVRALG
jgi:diguanylate cyclase (GGDEF)-like protein